MAQIDTLYNALIDGAPHRSDELVSRVYGLENGVFLARLGARIWDLKKKYRVEIKSYPDPENRKLWFYQIVKESEPMHEKPKHSIESRVELARKLRHFGDNFPTMQRDLFA
jgi:hypothetical protein